MVSIICFFLGVHPQYPNCRAMYKRMILVGGTSLQRILMIEPCDLTVIRNSGAGVDAPICSIFEGLWFGEAIP